MKNDMQIKSEVLAELGLEHSVVAGTVGVEVHHGVVKLAGRVGDGSIKEHAELAARRVTDVSNVVMDIDVVGLGAAQPAGATPSVARAASSR